MIAVVLHLSAATVPCQSQDLTSDPGQSAATIRYVTGILLRQVPPSIEGDKDWGNTKRIWSGVKMRFEDGKLRTHRRWKEVDHGLWFRYQIDLPDEGLKLDQSVHLHSVQSFGDTQRITATLDTPLDFELRVQRHRLGVRMSSVTVTGHARLQLHTVTDLSIVPDYLEIPPAIVIDPVVREANLVLDRFEVDRISRIGGDAAEAWGEVVQAVLVERWVAQQNDSLAEKMNRAIEKNRDDLRLSPQSFMRRVLASPDRLPGDSLTDATATP